ncbi:Transcriptional regulator, AcrR family [Olavius algarvensis associated proteobacterium Delta 3]|nr:Transcriptional regulator, AcrR family [Olavius algarvensis associated proteobacterium Delta 3]CAB5168801.1 Transcriptional regulator, AcrR family [Olavius algarvensis associated proteobacterium Delta 3]
MNKKHQILNAAAKLFATQGFDGTTTLQIATEAGVTEPLIYYHFKGKDELFTSILQTAFEKYFTRLENLPRRTTIQFVQIANLINLHFAIVDEMPNETFLVMNTCPVKLNDPDHVCRANVDRQKEWLTGYLTQCLEEGIRRQEFVEMPIAPTVELLIGVISGLTRRRALKLDSNRQVRTATIDFCRRALQAVDAKS